MQLRDLKSSWRQFKLQNAMQPVSTTEILAIIDQDVLYQDSRLKRVVGNLVMFLVIIMICQGG